MEHMAGRTKKIIALAIIFSILSLSVLTLTASAAQPKQVTPAPAKPKPNFALSANPTPITIKHGTAKVVTIGVMAVNGLKGQVALSVTSPNAVKPHLAAPSVTFGAKTTQLLTDKLTISIPLRTVPGTYRVVVTGTFGQLLHATTIVVKVVA
jgi:hypothetical protein